MSGVKLTGNEMLNAAVENKKVAIVGNAASLFGRHYGNLIDDHDIVIRFNKPAPIVCDYDVSNTHGTKFDVWAFWTVGAFYNRFINTDEATAEFKELFETKHPMKIQAAVNGHKELTKRYIDDTCPITTFTSLRNRLRIHDTKTNPSAGLCIIEWVTSCHTKSVSVFGMDFKASPTFSEPTRYETDMDRKIDTRCKHDYGLEETYFRAALADKVALYL
jgi:hypothetical protein